MASGRYDAIVVGAGHNGLVAATLLARAGKSVLVLERSTEIGGATVSGRPFPGVDARLSRYAYLVSLFPRALVRQLGLNLELRTRRIAAYTPYEDTGLLDDRAAPDRLAHLTGPVAQKVFPTMLEPLRSRAEMRRHLADDAAWEALFERPLSHTLETALGDDLVRGIVLTDATIGTFAAADDPQLRQNRCFLYHVIGNGTGRWDVPVGGMGAVTTALAAAARAAGAEIRTASEVTSLATDGRRAEVELADATRIATGHVLVGAAPAVLARLLGEPAPDPAPEGSQLKLNMLLRRLPRLRDPDVTPEQAFAGTFHIHESYSELQAAHAAAVRGELPDPVPCEMYCHSLTDPTILGPELRRAGAHTLTLFALHTPARLFDTISKHDAVTATLRSVNSVLAEPIEPLLWSDADGKPCLEAVTPPELERALAMPGGHIFHRDLAWPFAESDAEVGTWGVETAHANVLLCGAGARRGGGVSGIPGHNAARALLAL